MGDMAARLTGNEGDINTFRIRYLLSDKWSLQAESGPGTSADAMYTIER